MAQNTANVYAGLLVGRLAAKGQTITTVESCTGGAICAALVDVPGASDVLREAFVTYCDSAKRALVGVKKKTLRRYTAVSRQVAKQMAAGGRKRAKADICLSATGIAGPGGTPAFPAGLVYIGCSVKGFCQVAEYHFSGDRNEVRRAAVTAALQLALSCLDQVEKKER